MSSTLGSPSGAALLGDIRSLFKSGKVFYALRTHVAFVCGGNKKTDLRPRFIRYVAHSKSTIAVFRAESALEELVDGRDPKFTNVGRLEKLIAKVFDSILIFPESPGSYAELGFFAHDKEIRKRTLIVNPDNRQMDSFLNLGPIAAIDADSSYSPTIHVRKENPDFRLVVQRLMRTTSKRHHRDPFEFGPFKKMPHKDRLFSIAEIVKIFGVIHRDGLNACLETAFGAVPKTELDTLLAILCAAEIVERSASNSDIYSATRRAQHFFEYDHFDLNRLKAGIAQYYRRHDRACADLLKRLG